MKLKKCLVMKMKLKSEISSSAEKNLEFNRQNQEEKGLKILTPD